MSATGLDSVGRVLGPRPELAALYSEMVARLWSDSSLDRVTLELCRIRMATLLGDGEGVRERTPEAMEAGLTEQLINSVGGWPQEPAFSDAQKAALAVAEQFVIDVHGVSDEDFRRLREHFDSAACVAFAVAFGIFDGASRLRIALGAR